MLADVRTVAFAGHVRAVEGVTPDALRMAVAAALAEVRRAFDPAPLLLVGHAEGADRVAIDIWRELGGPVAVVHPFLPAPSPTGEAAVAAHEVWLDGATAQRDGTHPHLDQTRWLIGYADLLVAFWTGERARGPGGTADAVALAVGSDIPVVWVRPGPDLPPLLIPSDRIPEQTELAELAAGFGEPLPVATAGAIAESCVAGSLSRFRYESPGRLDCLLGATVWRSYSLFRRALGGRPRSSAELPSPADLQEQPGFAALTQRYAAAEAHANEQAAIHRSEQLLLILLAVLAAGVGASPLSKAIAIVAEFVLAIVAFCTWWTAERAHRHERWGNARSDAEALRIARAAWALGIRPWKGARKVAMVASPVGEMSMDRRLRWAHWGLDQLIASQRNYHVRQSCVDHRIARKLEQLENATFVLLLVTMSSVIAITLLHWGMTAMPTWMEDGTIMIGALVPVIGAASMALEAKFGFSEHAVRSQRLAARLDEIAGKVRQDRPLKALLPAGREAIAALREESAMWAEGVHRRALFRGG